jgi:hypothetical protein
LIATLPVDAAHHVQRALCVGLAGLLLIQLTHLERTVRRDTTLAIWAIPRFFAFGVTTTKCTDKRRMAVGVDQTTLGKGGAGLLFGRAAADEQGNHE